MAEEERTPLLRGKVLIEGILVVKTGLHIGSQAAQMEIGSVDSPVIRDPLSQRPYIPGSSLKGKLRSLVEHSLGDPVINRFDREGGSGVFRHECARPECPSCRLFGSAGRRNEKNIPGRLAVRDLFLRDDSVEELERIETGLLYTEWKFENALDRLTSAANPRQIERVPAGSRFDFQLMYSLEAPPDVAGEDLDHVFLGLRLLEDDALGGHGSRGYGRVAFTEVTVRRREIAYYMGDPQAEENRKVGTPGGWSPELRQWAAA